jgi:hypothetical protein
MCELIAEMILDTAQCEFQIRQHDFTGTAACLGQSAQRSIFGFWSLISIFGEEDFHDLEGCPGLF